MQQPLKSGIDYLTRCYMREGLGPFLKALEQETLLHKKPFSLLVMDVDHFKSFNDKYGHLSGDEVLKYFSSSMRLDLEDEENFAFRFGGDEFVVVFPLKNAAEANRLAVRLRRNMRRRSCIIKGRQIKITFSGGIACFPDDAQTVEELFEKADKALYYSKNHGRARITYSSRIRYAKVIQIGAFLFIVFAALFATNAFQGLWTPTMGFLKNYEFRVDFEKKPEASPPSPALTEIPPPPPEPFKPLPPPPPVSSRPEIATIYLLSGRAIRGEIVEEGVEEITLQLSLKEGKGEMKIKRSQIVTIQKEA